jgi:hypothetical protein
MMKEYNESILSRATVVAILHRRHVDIDDDAECENISEDDLQKICIIDKNIYR